ncbi:MAG: phage baseplate protein, partial [Ktedonobacteraceae bacterium]
MQTLSSQSIVQLWESGLRQRPVERMLTLLAAALPEVPRQNILVLSIGQCDAYLLLLHERMFGSRFVGFTECSHCQEQLEFSFTVTDMWAGATPVDEVGKVYSCQIEDYEIQLRLPTIADMLAISECQNVASARFLLLQRCIVQAMRKGDGMPVKALPDEVTTMLGERVLERDPQAEIQIDMTCPQCQHQQPALFDVSRFLWTEIQAQAKRLLREVHILARAYGWRETEILALSNVRRQYYLEMVAE